ncbi:MAG: PAS domain S-box protein [Spirochaetales bacterium]|nr:PAS domain S-box protein [Spirochaetales bacterium]MCF7939802.1 PAS domain S-box protein [Spirochaetales bacterium]
MIELGTETGLSSRQKTILLVEDEALIALAQKKTIEKHGFSVVTAHTGEQAVETVKENPEITLILMDIDLGPDMDGTEAAQTILRMRELPIVFLTSHNEKEYVDRVKKITGFGYVLKNSGEFVLIESINMAYKLFEAKQTAQKHYEESEAAYREMESREFRLQHVNRVLLSIRNVNQVITTGSDLDTLLKKSCRLLIETSGYHQSWIILLENGKPAEPFYHAGFDNRFPSGEETLLNGYIPQCARKALETGEVVVHRNPEAGCSDCPFSGSLSPETPRNGNRFSMTAALEHNGIQFGWISVVLPAVYIENPDELSLFREIAGDLSYALNSLNIEQQKKKTERALQISEEKYRALYENAPLPYQSLDKNGNFIDVNPAWLKTLGYSREEVVGKNFSEFLHPGWKQHFNENFPSFKRKGFIHDVRFRIRHKDGSFRRISFEGCVGTNQDGSFRQTYCVFKDITEEYRKQQEVKESRDFLNGVFNSIQDGVSVLNTDLSIRYVNPVMEHWYPSMVPLEGKRCFEAYHHRHSPCNPCPSRRCIQTGKTEAEEVPGSPDPGSPVKWIELFSYPLRDSESGNITGVIEFVRDITERKQSEQQLKKAYEEKNFLMAELNHRVRNNLNMITSLISMKEENSEAPADLAEIKAQIEAVRIVHQKLENSENPSRINLKDYIQSILSGIFTSSPEPVAIENKISTGLVPTKTAIALGLITNEIATNALKYGFRAGEQAVFQVELERSEESGSQSCRYTLSNTGNSFPASIDPETTETLGLRLINALVEQLEGELELRREPFPVFTIRFSLR